MSLFKYPDIGSTGNWGAILNNNFTIAEDEINKIYNNINSLNNLIGSQVPYINLDDTQYFVKICLIKDDGVTIDGTEYKKGVVLRYYEKNKGNPSDDSVKPKTVYVREEGQEQWNPTIPLYLAAYVFDTYIYITDNGIVTATALSELTDITQNSDYELDGTVYQRGDILVRVQEFGGLYDINIFNTVFKKYPAMGEYYKPIVQDTPNWRLKFDKVNYVDWFFQSEDDLEYSLPALGMGTTYITEYSNFTGDSYSFGLEIDDITYEHNIDVQFYLVSGAMNTPIYVSYAYKFVSDSDKPLQIQFDTAELKNIVNKDTFLRIKVFIVKNEMKSNDT